MNKIFVNTTTEPTEHTRQSADADCSDLSDAIVAYQIMMTGRQDFDHEAKLTLGRNRILKLSAALWDTRKELDLIYAALAKSNQDKADLGGYPKGVIWNRLAQT